jgi:hypothetical protein
MSNELDSILEINSTRKEENSLQNYGNQKNESQTPLFLYIPISRLILLSILSFGIYQAYWIYKNWWFINKRDKQKIQPFWRGIFGILFCHSLLRRIHEDKEACSIATPTFSPNGLATGWVILMIFSNILSRASGIAGSIIAAFIPSYLCLVPVQNYINTVKEKRNSGSQFYDWSFGHLVCLIIGIIIWFIFLIRLGS